MKRIVMTAVLLAALGVGGYGLFLLGVQRGAERATAATTPASGSIDPATGRRVLYWHDPMVPNQRFDKPGKSPFMDMQLVPVYADESGAGGGVAIDSRLQQNLGIRTAEVVSGTLTETLDAVGTVAYNERDVAMVQARANGFVERLFVRAPLDSVRKGQPLAELYVPDWVAAQEEYLTVRRMRVEDQLVDGARQRMRLAGMTDDQIAAVEATGTLQPRLTVVAPIGGVVAELSAREGMTVMAGAPLFRLNGLGTVWVNAEVPESMAAGIRPGARVDATTTALPEKIFKGRVSALLPEVNPTTRTLKARVELTNPRAELVPGMFARVSFAPGARHEMLLVASDAVIRTGRRNLVMEALPDGKFAPIEVEIGAESGGRTEIRKGLTPGRKIVVSGQFLIDSEASLKGLDLRLKDAPAGGPDAAPAGAAASAVAAPRAGTAAPSIGEVHRGTGEVESIDAREVMLTHEPIPSMKWPAMTMGFRLPAGRPKSVAPGSTVQFEFRQTPDGEFEIVTITPMARDSRAAAPATSAAPAATHDHGGHP